MDMWRGLRELLVAVTLGAGLLWACPADATVTHPGHPGHTQAARATDASVGPSEPASGLVADSLGHPTESVGTDALSAVDDVAACMHGHCSWCAAMPARAGAAAVPPPVREEPRAATHLRPGRCTAPETPPPIA